MEIVRILPPRPFKIRGLPVQRHQTTDSEDIPAILLDPTVPLMTGFHFQFQSQCSLRPLLAVPHSGSEI